METSFILCDTVLYAYTSTCFYMYNNDFIIPSIVGGKGSSTDGEHSISAMSVP